jgi:hypothetical protein
MKEDLKGHEQEQYEVWKTKDETEENLKDQHKMQKNQC